MVSDEFVYCLFSAVISAMAALSFITILFNKNHKEDE